MGNLPEGFCPNSLQEFGQAIAARLIITPSQNFNSFAIGSTAPTSNVGPWFKDCQEWFVYDDATASYIPLSIRGAIPNQQYFTASGNFVVPDFVYKIRIHAWGAGGGGSNFGASMGSGGGAGGYGVLTATVMPAQNIPYTIGIGGPNGAAGTAGGSTIILGMTCNGGGGGAVPATNTTGQGNGGTVTGSDRSVSGGAGHCPNANVGGEGGVAGGGGGSGGMGDSADVTLAGRTPGGGGAGGTSGGSGAGGSGAGGAILIEY